MLKLTIIKEKDAINAKDIRVISGLKQEEDVSYFLRRSLKESDIHYVINDLRIECEGETAQIDHLIVHHLGFIIIESKSIVGEVKVNKFEEWSRSLNGKWSGIMSPIKQAEMQSSILRRLLNNNANLMLGKVLGMQKYFSGYCWEQLCAISSSAIIHRENIPEEINSKIVKSEFLEEKINSMTSYSFMKSFFSLKIEDSKIRLSKIEMERICDFLLKQHNPKGMSKNTENESQISTLSKQSLSIEVSNSQTSTMTCKHCKSLNLDPQYGRYGYYVNCKDCGKNTQMKKPCSTCGSANVKVTKKSSTYTLTCECGNSEQVL